MKTGDTIELIEDTSFYKRGKKAHFIRVSNRNSNNIEFGDVDEYPIKLFKKVYAE